MALEVFEKHRQVREINAFECRSWQSDILEYVNNQMQNKVIWVVGEKGNEGDTFFQSNIHEEFGLLEEESIKDGNLKKRNVFIVFASSEPDREKISEYRWIILKISQDLKCLKEITDDSCKLR